MYQIGDQVTSSGGSGHFTRTYERTAVMISTDGERITSTFLADITRPHNPTNIGAHGVIRRLLERLSRAPSDQFALIELHAIMAGSADLRVCSPLLFFIANAMIMATYDKMRAPGGDRVRRQFDDDHLAARPLAAGQWEGMAPGQQQRFRDHVPWLEPMLHAPSRDDLLQRLASLREQCQSGQIPWDLAAAMAPLDALDNSLHGLATPIERPEPGEIVAFNDEERLFLSPLSEVTAVWKLGDRVNRLTHDCLPVLVTRPPGLGRIEGREWVQLLLSLSNEEIAAPLLVKALRDSAGEDALPWAVYCLALLQLAETPGQLKRSQKDLKLALKALSAGQRKVMTERFHEARATLANASVTPSGDAWETMRFLRSLFRATAPTDTGAAPPQAAPLAQPKPPARGNSTGHLHPNRSISHRAKPAPSGKVHRLLEAEWSVDRSHAGAITDLALRWIEEKIGVSLTEGWTSGAHEFEFRGKRVETERVPGVMAFRLEHPDADAGRHGTSRRWRVEGTIVEPSGNDEVVMCAIRLSALDGVKELDLPAFSIPNLAKSWLSTGALRLLGQVADTCWAVQTPMDFFNLRRLLEAPTRDAGVIVTCGEPVELAFRLRGIALHVHVATSHEAAYRKRFGALEAGHAHVYRIDVSEPVTMPLADAAQQELCVRAAAGRGTSRLPTFSDVRAHVRKAQIEHARRQGKLDLQGRHSEQSEFQMEEPLEASVDDTDALLDLAMSDLDAANEQIQSLKRQLQAERQQVHALKLALGTAPEQVLVDDAEPLPDTFASLEAWAKPLRPRLVLGAKAVRHARDCESFQDKPLVYASLKALASHYWEMRWGDRDKGRRDWEAFLETSRLSMAPVGTAADNHRFADAYRVTVDKRSFPLDLHLQGSSSRDPNRCLRIYLHCDDERKRLLVGHLPTHLPNTLT